MSILAMRKKIFKYKKTYREEKDRCCKDCEYCYNPHVLNHYRTDFILSRCKHTERSYFYSDPCRIGKFKGKSNNDKPPL